MTVVPRVQWSASAARSEDAVAPDGLPPWLVAAPFSSSPRRPRPASISLPQWPVLSAPPPWRLSEVVRSQRVRRSPDRVGMGPPDRLAADADEPSVPQEGSAGA